MKECARAKQKQAPSRELITLNVLKCCARFTITQHQMIMPAIIIKLETIARMPEHEKHPPLFRRQMNGNKNRLNASVNKSQRRGFVVSLSTYVASGVKWSGRRL